LNTLEIILPLRNPTNVLEQTAKSLVTQSDRRFSVLLSDNHSTKGGEWIDAAAAQFQAAGITVRRVRPPFELGRVEHWNWAHHEATGDWVKPVFAGDWLEKDYVQKLRAAALANPGCRYIYVSFVIHRMDVPPETVRSAWAGKFKSAAEMEQVVLRYGMQFGPPSAAAYEREAFIEVGGYPTALPICSDSLMFCAMASRYGALGLTDALCHFNIHGARFSTDLHQRKKDTFRESMTYYLMLGYRAWADKIAFSKVAFAKMLLRETRSYFAKK
jgi:glycosyltransferase involved in cell wall biosynthesis